MSRKKLIVIGGGAAGFFCAVNAARMNTLLDVTILEKSSRLLSKVRVSGGGRCNVTHQLSDITEMSKRYPRGQHFVRKAFHQFFTSDTIRWFSERGVELKAEKDGRMFPVTDSSETIINCLMQEANRYGVEIRMNREVQEIQTGEQGFRIRLAGREEISADYICIASGGYSKLSQFEWLQQTGHSIVPPVPSLFTFNLPAHPITKLMGVSVETAKVKIEGSKLVEEGPVLLTHWGLSGPAVLRLSAWGARELHQKNYHFRVHINWMPGVTVEELKQSFALNRNAHPSKKLLNFSQPLPSRLWQFLLQQSGIPEETRFSGFRSKMENLLIAHLTDFVVEVKGKTSFKEEFVTAGGINLNEIDAATMMSKKIPNLYFAGEVMDVDGITGGFNFQHAWTSGWIAASSIAGKIAEV